MNIVVPPLSDYTTTDFLLIGLICLVEFIILAFIFRVMCRLKLKKEDQKMRVILGLENNVNQETLRKNLNKEN